MSENLEGNEPQIIPSAVDNTQNKHVEPLIGTECAPRVARSVSNGPGEPALPSSDVTTPMHPAPCRSAPRARCMSLSLTRVDAWPVVKTTFILFIAVAIIQVVASAIVWVLLDVVGVFSQITQIVLSTGLDANGLDPKNVLSPTAAISGVAIFLIVEVVTFTLLATTATLIYNVVSSLVGGMHATPSDDRYSYTDGTLLNEPHLDCWIGVTQIRQSKVWLLVCGDHRRRCWAETWDSGDAGGGRRRRWNRFCIFDDAMEGSPSPAVQILESCRH